MTTIVSPEYASNAGPADPVTRAAPAVRPRRTRRGPGPGVRPSARPARAVPAPELRRGSRLATRSCTVTPEADRPQTAAAGWRLTDRGVALLLVTAAMIVTAAVVVVGLTAIRVTGERYQSYGQVTAVQS
jgi:hypothetical protein